MKLLRFLRRLPAALASGDRAEAALAGFAAPLLLCVLLSTPFLYGCATTPQGVAREQQVYQTATNLVAGVQAVTPYLPAPVQFPTEIALAAVTAALSAWNIHQQKAIKALKNGSGNPAGNGSSPALVASKAIPTPIPPSP